MTECNELTANIDSDDGEHEGSDADCNCVLVTPCSLV